MHGELALKLEPLIAARAKANQQAGGGSGASGRQNSDNPVDTKRELAQAAGVSHDTIAKAKLRVEAVIQRVTQRLMMPDGSAMRRGKSTAISTTRCAYCGRRKEVLMTTTKRPWTPDAAWERWTESDAPLVGLVTEPDSPACALRLSVSLSRPDAERLAARAAERDQDVQEFVARLLAEAIDGP